MALILDAVSFNLITSDKTMSDILFRLCDIADVIILANCLPEDKAQAVRFVRTRGRHLPLDQARETVRESWRELRSGIREWKTVRTLVGSIFNVAWNKVVEGVHDEIVTLAVARGSSDIAQMSAANVGVAIGNVSLTHANEAVLCSDYSLPRFTQLYRLVLVHGHWQYHRLCQVSSICIYKSMVLPTIQFLHGAFNGYSGVIFIPEVLHDMFDLVLTFIPVLVTGISDKDVSDDIAETDPRVYFRDGTRRAGFGLGYTLRAMLNGIVDAVSIFFMTMSAINAWESLGFRLIPKLILTSAVDNNSMGSLYTSAILTFFVACATVLLRVINAMTAPTLNVTFVSLVSFLAAYFWVQVGAALDTTIASDVANGIDPIRFALIIVLIAFSVIVLNMTLIRVRYLISPTLSEQVQALEQCVKQLRTKLLLSKVITASVTFADMYTTLLIRLVPFMEHSLVVAGAKADRFNGTFALLSGQIWQALSSLPSAQVGSSDPDIIKQRSHSVSLSRSLNSFSSESTAIVEQTPDGISVRRLSVLRSRSSSTVQRRPTPVSNERTLSSETYSSFMMMKRFSTSSIRYSLSQKRSEESSSAIMPNFRREQQQKLSSYGITLSPLTLKFVASLSEMDTVQKRRAQSECEERERSFRFHTEKRTWRVLRLYLGLVGIILLAYSIIQVQLAQSWGTPRTFIVSAWISLLIIVLDRFRPLAMRRIIILLCIFLSAIKCLTLWPTPGDLARRSSINGNQKFSRPVLMPLLAAILFPYLIFTTIRFYFVDALAIVFMDWVVMNICLTFPDEVFAPLSTSEVILLNSAYLAIAVTAAYQCYLDERRRRIYFLQCRRYRVLFSLSCSVCDDMLPNAEIGSNTKSTKLDSINQVCTISGFRSFVNAALGSIPSQSSFSATCLVIGVDSLSSLIQNRSPAQTVSMLSKIHEVIITALKRTAAKPDLQISCMGSGHGALIIAYIGTGTAPECDSALEMCRIAIHLLELSDARTSQLLFGAMLTLSMGIDTGRLVNGPVPCWDVADDDVVPPRIYSSVVGEAIQGARIAQTVAEPGNVCIGSSTFTLIRHLYSTEPIKRSSDDGLNQTDITSQQSMSRSETTTSVEQEKSNLQHEQINEISSMISFLRAGLKVRNRKIFFRNVPNCFSGAEVIDLLMSANHVVSRFDGVKVGNALIVRNAFVHAFKDGRQFFDDPNELYRWRISRDIDIANVISVLKKNVQPSQNKSWFRSYPKTFTASSVIDCLVTKNISDTREYAVQIGQYLVLKSVLHSEFGIRRPFADNHDLYRFTSAERVDLHALTLGLQRNLDLKTRTFRGRNFTGTFLGSEAVTFMLDAGLAVCVQQAVDFGNFLRVNGKLRHVSDLTIPFLNSNDIYVLLSKGSITDRTSARSSLHIASFHKNSFYKLTGVVKQENDDVERLINSKAFVRRLGTRVRVEEQDTRLIEAHVPLTLTLKYDIQELITTSAISVPWANLEQDYQNVRQDNLLQKLAHGYDPAILIGLWELFNLIVLQFDAANFAVLLIYLIASGALSFLIQSPLWSGLLNRILEHRYCTAGQLLFRLGLQAINTFGFLILLTSRNRDLVPNPSTVCLALVFMTATLQNPALTYLESLLIGCIFFVAIIINLFALESVIIPETLFAASILIFVLVSQLVVCRKREIYARRLFFLEWVGNQHRRTIHRLLPRLVPRPIAAHLDMSFEPQGWLCNNVVVGQIELAHLFQLLDLYRSSPHETIAVVSKLFEKFNSIGQQYSCMNLLSGGSSYVFVCGFRHAQEEFELDTDAETEAQPGQGPKIRAFNAVQAALKMVRAAAEIEKELDLDERCLSVACGVAVGGVLSAVLPGSSLRHSIYGDTVDLAAQLAFSCPKGLVHCSADAKRLISKMEKPAIQLAFARSRQVVPGQTTFLVRVKGDPFPSQHTDERASMEIKNISSALAVTSMAKKISKCAKRFKPGFELDAVEEHSDHGQNQPEESPEEFEPKTQETDALLTEVNEEDRNEATASLFSLRKTRTSPRGIHTADVVPETTEKEKDNLSMKPWKPSFLKTLSSKVSPMNEEESKTLENGIIETDEDPPTNNGAEI